MSGELSWLCPKCGKTWRAEAPTHCQECSSFAAPTGLAALVDLWKGRLDKMRAEQKRYEQMGWHMRGPGTDLKLQGNELEKCIQELEAANHIET